MMHGLNTYDYGARQYDPILGSWDRMDPLCEKYYSVSPYAYCHNNPVMLVDPDGRDDYFDRYGAFQKHTDKGDAVLIQTADNSYTSITNVDFRSQQQALVNIGSHYLSTVDHDFTLAVEQTGNGNPLEAGMGNYEGTGKYVLFIDAEGKVNPEYGIASNVVNSFFHESRHRYDNTTWGGTLGEVNAILQQTAHPSWLGVSETFAQSQASYAAGKLNSYSKGFGSLINSYVQRLNASFLGVATFTIINKKVSVENNLKGVVIYGNKKE